MEYLQDIVGYINRTLAVDSVTDYCPNGLQVEGRKEINKIVSGVTASQALLNAAIEAHADAILVHHGYFWKGESARLTGMRGARIKTLMQADISLLAYHLPLDIHRSIGNNACLADRLSIDVHGQQSAGGVPGLLWYGELREPMSEQAFIQHVSERLQRQPVAVGKSGKSIHKVAWCSGGAQGYISDAAALQIDAYISGEISEQTMHEACEQGLLYLAAGHHATERFGVQALGQLLAQQFSVEHEFVDIENPA